MLDEKLQFKCIFGDLGTVSGRLVVCVCSAQRHSYRLRRSRFDSRAGHRQQLAIAATFLRNCVAYVLSRGNGPRVRYTLRRNTARVMKTWCFSSVLVKLFQMLNFFLRCYCYRTVSFLNLQHVVPRFVFIAESGHFVFYSGSY